MLKTMFQTVKKLGLLLLILVPCLLSAAEPTKQPTNITITQLTCVDVQISWSNGDGAWRLMLIKQGGSVDAVPVDGTVGYNAQSKYGMGTNIGSGNYVAMNAPISSIKITGLQQNTQYCIALFESDGSGAPDFLTSNPATYCFTTQNVTPDFSWTYTDSCQHSNKFDFKNNTTATFSGITYTWEFGDGQSGTGVDVSHKYDSGGVFNVTLIANNAYKCPNNRKTISGRLLVIPRPISTPIEENMDTIQCLTGNLFKFFDGTTFDNVVNTAVMRTWYFGPNDSSTITRPTKVYPTAGRRRIFFRSEVLFKNAPTGCTDTTSLYIEVLPDPSSGGGVNDSLQCLAGNNFIFDNTAKNITSYKWKFSSTDEVTTKSASRSFSAPGIYHVEHSATTNIGCQSRDTITVIVKPNTDASFTVSDPFVCQFDPLVDLTPVDPSGIFYGKHLVDDKQFDPVLPGYYPIKHVVTDTFCPDSQTLVIQVVTAPVFSLGNDTSVCNGNTFTVNISEPGTVVWHDGDVNKTRNFNNSGDYWATLSDSGCSYSDTVNLFVGNTPVVNWPFDTIICKKEILRLEVPKPPGTTLQWSTGSTESIVYINGPGTYTVTATNGCGKTIGTIIVAALDENCDMFIPTAFTPDGSGKNETWKLVERRDLTYMKFLIYDRWGTIVYDAMKTGKYEWDGSYMGRQVMQGIYHYVVIYETGEGDARRRGSVKGYINLIR